MWARLGVKHPGTGEPSIGVRDILMFSMLINFLLLLLLLLDILKEHTGHAESCSPDTFKVINTPSEHIQE
jgi:hypothetical protein